MFEVQYVEISLRTGPKAIKLVDFSSSMFWENEKFWTPYKRWQDQLQQKCNIRHTQV